MFTAGDRVLCSLCPGGGHGVHPLCALDWVERATVGKPVCRPAKAWGAAQGRNLILTLGIVPGFGEVPGDRYVDDPAWRFFS